MEDNKITGYIARDEDGTLCFFKNKPYKYHYKSTGVWTLDFPFCEKEIYILPDELYPDVKWDNEEPIKVELFIKIINKKLIDQNLPKEYGPINFGRDISIIHA